VRLKLLGEDLVFFRGASDGEIAALADARPHRGGSLAWQFLPQLSTHP
jgi:phenylpropionate dioxygenase-like ring-hydroxylating dioxygenase large terminal subunit